MVGRGNPGSEYMRIAFIGFGEAAGAIISGWGPARIGEITAFDIKSLNADTAAEIKARADAMSVRLCETPADALQGAELVFSTVTADQAVAAAEAYAREVPTNVPWCDLNSCAPSSKVSAAEIIARAGARYLDVAVMAPVYPKRNMVPCLVSGRDARSLADILSLLPMNVRVVGTEVGRASSIKMVRSIMVKGLEALTAECTLAAVAAGVADEVFPSLKSGSPEIDVPKRAAYNFERSLVHGLRRSAEMDEVAKMLSDLGLPHQMSRAASCWQARMGGLNVEVPEGEPLPDHDWFARQILRGLGVDPQ